MLKSLNIKPLDLGVYFAILAGLYLSSLYNYLLFHSVAEIFSIIITFGIFMFVWNSREFMNNDYLLIIGVAYLFVGGLDLLHTLSYKGMGIFTGYGSNLPTQLWIAARYLQSISLLVSPFFFERKPNLKIVFSGYSLITAILLSSIFFWKIFPDCYIEGVGLTPFKKISEYIISLAFAVSLYHLLKHGTKFKQAVLRLMVLSIMFIIGAELAFTFYIDVYGASNLIGHIFKIISFYLVYKAVIETGIQEPYSLMFKDLKDNEVKLSLLNQTLETRVEERTAELHREIAERKQAELEVRDSRNMLQTVIDGISDPLFLVDRDLNLKTVNNSALVYLKTEPGEAGMAFSRLLSKKDGQGRERENFISSVRLGRHTTFEQKGLMDPDRIEKVTVYPLTRAIHKREGTVIHMEDITRGKLVERQLIQQEKLASLGFLVAGIAHEINNPINFVTFNLPILRDYFKEIFPIIDDFSRKNPEADFLGMNYEEFRTDINSLMDNMEHGAKRVGNIMTDLREFSSGGDSGPLSRVDIGEAVEKSISICMGKIKKMVRTLDVHIPKERPRISTDPRKVEQVLINLLINAAQACNKKDSLVKLDVNVSDPEWLTISIRDNGCGMDEDVKNKIFDPFFSTKPVGSGTGLGLYISLNLIEGLGGYIQVESKKDHGSHFMVNLPVSQPTAMKP